MPYAQVDDGLFAHPKAKRTSDAALGLWVLGLSYAARYLTDGRLDETFVADFIRSRPRKRLAAELVERGWWAHDGDGYVILGYLEHNRSREQVEEHRKQARDRQQRSRERRAQASLPWNGDSGVTA